MEAQSVCITVWWHPCRLCQTGYPLQSLGTAGNGTYTLTLALNLSLHVGDSAGVLVDQSANIQAWFGLELDRKACSMMGADTKGTIIYELEPLAAVLATHLWCSSECEDVFVIFGDNDGVRFSLIRACASGEIRQVGGRHRPALMVC